MSRRVLVVEDDSDHRNIYRMILIHSGYEVLEAMDGEEGIRMAREEQPDIILMDVSIPRIDGWEATRILKSDETTSAIPIIAITAHALKKARQEATEAGCDVYIPKPVEPRQVVEEVRRLIGPATG
jgi:two-component system cell cycle response regulator DivK